MTISQAGHPRRSNAGFTLLELVIVVILVAIVMALSVPRLSGTLGSTGITAGTRQVASMLRYARGRAVMDRLRYRVDLDLDAGEYWLTCEEDPIKKRGAFKPVGGNLGRRRSLPGSATFGEFHNGAKELRSSRDEDGSIRGDGIVFYPDGRGDPARLVVQGREGRRGYTIEVLPALGRVTLREGTEDDER